MLFNTYPTSIIVLLAFAFLHGDFTFAGSRPSDVPKGQMQALVKQIQDGNRVVSKPMQACPQSADPNSISGLLARDGVCPEPVPELTPKKNEKQNYPTTSFKDLRGDEIKLSVLSEEQALQLHKEMAKYDWRLRFNIPDDGCRARATIMSKAMSDMGIINGKIWTDPGWFGSIGDGVPNRRMSSSWKYHVAPFVLVNKGGKPVPYVIDPSVSKVPLPKDEYQKILSRNPDRNNVYMSNSAPYDPSQKWMHLSQPGVNDVGMAYQELDQLSAHLGRNKAQ